MDKHSLSEIQLLRSQYRDLVELIARLRRDLSFETQEGEKFKLEKRLEDEEIRKEIIKDKLTEIEEEIKRELIIYVSYSRDDGGTVSERVTKELKNEGYTAERGREFNPYDGLPQEYRQKIMDSTHVLVCITEKADQAISALQLELSYSLENNKNIIPLFFPNGNKPVQIFRYKEVNFNEWQTGLKQLTNALSAPSRSEIKKVIDNRDMELEYLQKITQEFDIWRSLYTEMTFSGKIKESKIKLKPAAATLLERNVQISKTAKISHRFEDDPSDMVTLETFEDLIETVTKYRRVAIIGDPGSGKTTTLHRMLYEFAAKAVKHQEQLIPVVVRLGEYSGGDFQSFLESSFNGFSISDYLPNRVIVMLDGLNEMPLGLVKNVEDWINHNPATFIIVSCRKLEYLERKLPLHRMDISPLRITQIFKFINNFFVEEDDTEHLFWALAGKSTFEAWQWFINENPNSSFENFWFGVTEHVRSYEDQKSVLKQIQDDIRERNTLPGLLGLVSNPYLLYAVIRIFYQNEKPPQNRGELFTQFVSQLLENKEKSKPKFDISQLILRNAMGKLSYRMQIERKGTSVSKKWVIEILRENFPEQNAEDLLLMAIGCGLLELRETDEAVFVRFSHQLLQEYFAAYEMDEDIKRGVLAQKFWPNEKWWEPTGWEETAMLLAGIQGDATKIVEWLAPIHPTLAFFCATESGVPCDSTP